MSFIQRLGQLRAAVSTYSALPITSNVIGDLRTVNDLGVLYTWMNQNASGSLSDWHKVTVASYNDLQGRPDASPLAIDNAIYEIRNIFLNYILIFFVTSINFSVSAMKMLNGVLDKFFDENAVDLTRTTGQRHVMVNGMTGPIAYYKNNFDGSLDQYTKVLIHGYELNGESFFDDLYNDIFVTNVTTDSVTTKFGNKSLVFNGSNYLSFYGVNEDGNPFTVNGVDFTWDFQVRCNTNNAETIIVDHSFNHSDGTNFKIEKLSDKTLKVSVRGCTTYGWDNQWIPNNPVSYDVTSVNTIEQNTWYYVMVVRNNGYLKLFINGNLEATSSVADTQAIIDYTNDMQGTIGGEEQSFRIGSGLNGRLEEVRFSKGIARYTSNFTAPTVAYNTPTQAAPCNNMVIQSNGYSAATVSTSARVVVFEHDIEQAGVVANTDLKVYVSRDGGTTFTQASDLKIEFDVMREQVSYYISTNVNFFVGTVDLSSQPSGKEMVYKITTHNNKNLSIRSVAMNWK